MLKWNWDEAKYRENREKKKLKEKDEVQEEAKNS